MKTQTAAYIKDYPRPQMVRTSWKNLMVIGNSGLMIIKRVTQRMV